MEKERQREEDREGEKEKERGKERKGKRENIKNWLLQLWKSASPNPQYRPAGWSPRRAYVAEVKRRSAAGFSLAGGGQAFCSIQAVI